MNLKYWRKKKKKKKKKKLTSIAKALPQPAKGQAKSCFPSWKTRTWFWRLKFVVKLFSQPSLMHLNMRRSPEWTDCLCFCKNQALWNIFWHWSHGRVTVNKIWLSTGTLQLAFKLIMKVTEHIPLCAVFLCFWYSDQVFPLKLQYSSSHG